jgi:glycosyltransferase involved in cell wall biosynthesis
MVRRASAVASAGDPARTHGAALDAGRPPGSVGVVGDSIDEPCGVHDHAVLLDGALQVEGLSCSLHWLRRTSGSLRTGQAEIRAWTRTLARELQHERADAILLHYSVFALSHRGFPMFVRPLLSLLGHLRIPLVTFMHEYAYPWRLGGMRGKAWAVTQRAALIDVMRTSAGAVVSTDARADWLNTRLWLPRRPISVAPVFSNLPPAAEAEGPVVADRIGLFGYAHEGVAVETVLDAMGMLREQGDARELVLLGAPERASTAGRRWESAAARRGLADALSFSGRLPAQDLAGELSSCAVLLFAETGGPTSRKTTLAASLSSGRPVVALDGRNSWKELLQARAAVVAQPDPRSLAQAVSRLLADDAARARQAELGRAFASTTMSVEHSAKIVGLALARAIEQTPR